MKVAIINRSDLTGGAAIFTYRLLQALRAEGIDANMLVTHRKGDDEHVVSYASAIPDAFHFYAERLEIFCSNGFSRTNLFTVDSANYGRSIDSLPQVQEADVVILNWVNQGAASLRSIERLCKMGKPVIWTMHDMWNCTGVCHHAYDCNGFESSCGTCPLLSSTSHNDLSHRTWCRKRELYKMPNLHFVSVSSWLAQKCHQSSLLHDRTIEVIPNTTDVSHFRYDRQPNADYGIPSHRYVLAMGAARLDNPIKGFDILIAVSQWIKEHRPQLAEKLHLLLFGDMRDTSLLQQLALPYTHLGPVSAHRVSDILAHSDVLLSTSLYESFGGTLIEGQAAGCMPVTFGNGGQVDIVDHKRNGYIAAYKDVADFAAGIEWAIEQGVERKFLHDEMLCRFSPQIVAGKYIKLFERLLR